VFDAPHLEGYVHAARAAIGAPHPLGQAAIRHAANEHRPGGIIAAEEIPTADYERFHVSPRFVDAEVGGEITRARLLGIEDCLVLPLQARP